MHRYLTRPIAALVTLAVIGFTGCAQPKKLPEPAAGAESAKTEKQTRPAADRYQEPANSYYYFMMAEIQIRQGNMDQAIAYLEKAIEADPDAVDIKKELALVYIQQDKTEQALKMADEILRQQPDNIEALIISASIRQALGELEKAKQAYEKVIAEAPDRKNIYLVLGRLYLQDKQFQEALEVFSRQVERFPDDYSGHFYLGQAYMATGAEERAIEEFSKTLALQPGLLEPRVELIKIYTARNEQEKAIRQYEAIIAQQPDNHAARIELALLYRKTGQAEEAQAVLDELGRLAQTDRTVINSVIQILIAPKRYGEAIAVLEGMLDAAPENQDVHYLAGITRYLKDDPAGALVHLEKVGPESQFYVDAAIQKAGIYSHRNEQDKAVSVLQTALENIKEPGSADKVKLIRFLSAFYEENEEFEKAIDLLNEGLSIDPENAELNYQLGVVYDQMGENQRAVEQMKTVLDLDPENADALNYLGYTYADAGIHLDEAERLVRKALEKKPANGYILDSMGWVYFRKGDYSQAVDYLEKAVEKVPDDPIILEHLGDAYAETGQVQKAIAAYERALLEKKDEKAGLEEKINRLRQP